MSKFDTNLEKAIKADLASKNTPFLIGEPGIGKSSWIKALGKALHTETFSMSCNQLGDKTDLTGPRTVPVERPNGETDYEQRFFPHATIARAIRYAEDNPRETPILFLDEINRSSSDITSAILTLITDRRMGDRLLPDNLKLIAAGNDKGNIIALDDASVSRFSFYSVEPDAEVFLNVMGNRINPFVKNVLMQHPETIFCKYVEVELADSDDDDDDKKIVSIDEMLDDSEPIHPFATPRTIEYVNNWLNELEPDDLKCFLNTMNDDHPLLQDYLEGKTGRTDFTKCLLGEISTNLLTLNADTSAKIKVPKPQAYDMLCAAGTAQDVETMISNMTDNEKSGTLIYALHDNRDNTIIINQLLANMTTLQPADVSMLMQISLNQMIDEENKQIFLNNNSPLAVSYKSILSIN